MQLARLISVTISAITICLVLIVGCGGKTVPFDEASALYSDVSGQKALEHVSALVAFGPRPAGTENLEKSRVYLIQQLEKTGWSVKKQTFSDSTPDGSMEFVNLRARFGAESWNENVTGLLCSHYDTKKFGFEFVGANDGGSSTGLLVELARVLANRPEVAKGIELVFFDGEEAFGPNITAVDGLYGSRYYASEWAKVAPKKRPVWGILLDMVGDKNLNIRAAIQIPQLSVREMQLQEELEQSIDIGSVKGELEEMSRHLLKAADDLGVRSQIGISSQFIIDDHLPLNRTAGIPTIDLIDFDYGNYWHTPGDTIDKLSAQSLETVGKVTILMVEKYLKQ